MQKIYRNIKSFNILSAALSLLFGGIFTSFSAIKTGLPILSVISGVMVGLSLGLFYLGAQWDNKTNVNMIFGLLATVTSAVSISLALLAVQGII